MLGDVELTLLGTPLLTLCSSSILVICYSVNTYQCGYFFLSRLIIDYVLQAIKQKLQIKMRTGSAEGGSSPQEGDKAGILFGSLITVNIPIVELETLLSSFR